MRGRLVRLAARLGEGDDDCYGCFDMGDKVRVGSILLAWVSKRILISSIGHIFIMRKRLSRQHHGLPSAAVSACFCDRERSVGSPHHFIIYCYISFLMFTLCKERNPPLILVPIDHSTASIVLFYYLFTSLLV